MTAALGVLLGAGLLLVASPWLWPRRRARERTRERAPGVLRTTLAQAGVVGVAPSVFVVVSTLLALAAGTVVLALAPVVGLALAAAVVAGLLPWVVVRGRATRRRRVLRGAWPDLVDHLVAGIRSGRSLTDAVAGLGELGPLETRPAFLAFDRTARATGNLGIALDELKDALADPVADRIVETLRMARDVGGTELPGILRDLSTFLRQENALRSEVEARQSWVVAAARLGVAAPWIVLLLLASRPEAAAAYNSPGGAVLLGSGLAVTVIAYRLMLMLGRLPEERRWFG